MASTQHIGRFVLMAVMLHMSSGAHASQDSTWTSTPGETLVLTNTDATLNWTYNMGGPVIIAWYRNTTANPGLTYIMGFRDNETYIPISDIAPRLNHIKFPGSAMMILRNMTSTDNGIYEAKVLDTLKNAITDEVIITSISRTDLTLIVAIGNKTVGLSVAENGTEVTLPNNALMEPADIFVGVSVGTLAPRPTVITIQNRVGEQLYSDHSCVENHICNKLVPLNETQNVNLQACLVITIEFDIQNLDLIYIKQTIVLEGTSTAVASTHLPKTNKTKIGLDTGIPLAVLSLAVLVTVVILIKIKTNICLRHSKSLACIDTLKIDPSTNHVLTLQKYLVPVDPTPGNCSADYKYEVCVDPRVAPGQCKRVTHLKMLVNGLQNSYGGFIAVTHKAKLDAKSRLNWAERLKSELPRNVEFEESSDFGTAGIVLCCLCVKRASQITPFENTKKDNPIKTHFALNDAGYMQMVRLEQPSIQDSVDKTFSVTIPSSSDEESPQHSLLEGHNESENISSGIVKDADKNISSNHSTVPNCDADAVDSTLCLQNDASQSAEPCFREQVDNLQKKCDDLSRENQKLRSRAGMTEARNPQYANHDILKYKEEMEHRRELRNKLVEQRGNIRVFCRVRPLSNEDKSNPPRSVVTVEPEDDTLISVEHENGKLFKLDRVFHSQSTQEDVFSAVEDVVISSVDGYNVCIFAYGQTGSGKTYTMEGTPDDPGVKQKALQSLMKETEERNNDWHFTITVSVLDIYNESVRDLLGEDPMAKVQIRVNPKGDPWIPGLTANTVTAVHDINRIFTESQKHRVTASTKMNTQSSRSHSMLSVEISGVNNVTEEQTKGKLNLVDLAGSERIGRTGAVGAALKEAEHINQSLSTLGNVFRALHCKQKHVPYRESKLTHLLKESLGGDSKVMMIVQVSPAVENASETMDTLRFAEKAMAVELRKAPKKQSLSTSGKQK